MKNWKSQSWNHFCIHFWLWTEWSLEFSGCLATMLVQAMQAMWWKWLYFADDVPTKVGPAIGDNLIGLTMALAITMAYFHKLHRQSVKDWWSYDGLVSFGIMESPLSCIKELLNEESAVVAIQTLTLFPLWRISLQRWLFLCRCCGRLPSPNGKEILQCYWNAGTAAGRKHTAQMKAVLLRRRIDTQDPAFFASKTQRQSWTTFSWHVICLVLLWIPFLNWWNILSSKQEIWIPVTDDGVGKEYCQGQPHDQGVKHLQLLKKQKSAMGRDTEKVLLEAGYTADEIAAFVQERNLLIQKILMAYPCGIWKPPDNTIMCDIMITQEGA